MSKNSKKRPRIRKATCVNYKKEFSLGDNTEARTIRRVASHNACVYHDGEYNISCVASTESPCELTALHVGDLKPDYSVWDTYDENLEDPIVDQLQYTPENKVKYPTSVFRTCCCSDWMYLECRVGFHEEAEVEGQDRLRL